MLVEEAGEVLEAHILSSLNSGTKNLILIGDHKQLRPKVESYELTTVSGGGYQLDCSLFERLVLNKLPSATLGTQHRMRPEISEFVRTQTYPTLKDHESVQNFANIRGVISNAVFIDHQFPETGEGMDGDYKMTKPRSNISEGECVLKL